MTKINLAELLQPISADNPTGVDLRPNSNQATSIDSLYYQIKDARQAARDIERRILLDSTLDEIPNWQKVADLAIDVLKNHSKDIEICTWLIEALLRLQSLPGLTIGFTILTQMINQYWDGLYPTNANDIELRVIAITSLNGDDYDGTLIQPLYQVAITADQGNGGYVLWQYQQAIENAKYTDKEQIAKKRQQGAIFLDEIQQAAIASGEKFYQNLLSSIAKTEQAFSQLNAVLQQHCASSAPPSSQIRETLAVLNEHVRYLINDAPFSITQPTEKIIAEMPTMRIQPTDSTPVTAEISDRQQAMQQLQHIADYFRQVEPQSPIPPLLDRAVRWGNLPFAELLREIIKDEGVRSNAYELMGLAE